MRLVFGTLEDISWVEKIEGSFNAVFHLALSDVRLDAHEDQRFIDAVMNRGIGRFIYFSSICAAGVDLSPQPLREECEPLFLAADFYGMYKWDVEQYLRARAAEGAFDAAIIRPTIVYGPGERANLFQLFQAVRKGNLAL